MNLANSFPVIFSQFTKKMFTIIYKSADYLSLIFEKKEDDENLPFIKTGYTALLFLLGALKSTLVIDDYFQWLFGRIETFTDIQVLCTFMILNTINDDIRIHYLSQIYVSKYSFFNTISKLLKRNVCEGYFMTCYKDNIYKYITDTYSLCLNYNMYIAAQIDELKKKEKPLNFAYNEIYYDTPRFSTDYFIIEVNTSQLDRYIKNATKQRDFWISYDFISNRTTFPNDYAINYFLSKLSKKNIQKIIFYQQ